MFLLRQRSCVVKTSIIFAVSIGFLWDCSFAKVVPNEYASTIIHSVKEKFDSKKDLSADQECDGSCVRSEKYPLKCDDSTVCSTATQSSDALSSGHKFNYNLLKKLHLQRWPDGSRTEAESLWKDRPAVVLVVRRMGCPLCRSIFAEVSKRRNEFEALGINLIAISQQDIGVQDFINDVWSGLPLYLDVEDLFRRAFGGEVRRTGIFLSLITPLLIYSGRQEYRLWWLLKPSVIWKILRGSLPASGGFADVNERSNRLGGELVLFESSVVYERQEDATFSHASVDDLLAAARAAANTVKR